MSARRWLVVAVLATLPVIVAIGYAMADVETPDYAVEASEGDFEVRRYPPMIVAEVTRSGTRRGAVNAGFQRLADYIFGANVPAETIAMTAPVTQAPAPEDGRDGQKIDMTAPVTQTRAAGGAWRVHFIMPADYTMATLPKPKADDIRIIEEPARRVAAVRFSGIPRDGKLAERTEALRAFMAGRGLAPAGDPTFAFYNPPWTLPFLRRNEVLIEIAG